jgi:anaerobic magnesium-protoporphyrin IX monomethyl ester cyclase
LAGILLTHSYLLAFDPKQQKLGQPYAPLGTLYAAALLRKEGFSFSFHDTMFFAGPGEILPAIRKEKPAVMIIYDDSFSYLTKMCLSNMRDAAYRMIGNAKEAGSTVIVSSSDAVDNYALYLDKGADFCLLGEGERTLIELVGILQRNESRDFGEVKGLAWKSANGIRVNKPRELITDLDELPFPAWDLVDMQRYREMWKRKNGYFTMNMVTTRGCPYFCAWCAKPNYGNHYNMRSPENVVREMTWLKGHFFPDNIWFADDIFALKPGWIDEFNGLLKNTGGILPYTIQARVDLLLNHNQIRPLAESGCKKIWLGVESGSQKILDAMQKGITVEQVYEVTPKLKEAGIDPAFFLQLGYPGETKEDIRKTIRLLTDLMPDDIGISVTYPLPGTKFYESVRKDMEGKTNWRDSNDLDLLFRSNFSPGYYKILHRYIHKYFRFKQGLSYFKRPAGNAGSRKKHLRRMLLVPYYLFFAWFYKLLLRKA